MEEEAKPDSIRFGLSILPIDEIFPLRSVGDHGDGVSDLVFNKFHIAPCIDWQVLILADTADIAFPAVQIGVDRLSPVQQRCDGEVVCLFAVNGVGGADGNRVKVAENVQQGKMQLASSLAAYSHTALRQHQTSPYAVDGL